MSIELVDGETVAVMAIQRADAAYADAEAQRLVHPRDPRTPHRRRRQLITFRRRRTGGAVAAQGPTTAPEGIHQDHVHTPHIDRRRRDRRGPARCRRPSPPRPPQADQHPDRRRRVCRSRLHPSDRRPRPDGRQQGCPTAKFVVTYVGFSTTAKAAFQHAVNTWAKTLTNMVPITVKATWEPLGTGILGSAGPAYGWNCSGLMCIDAIANKKAGKNLDPSPDIVARFSSNFSNWWFGTGPAPKGKYDFHSVVTHELGHGVGFLGLGSITGGLGSVQLSGLNTAYGPRHAARPDVDQRPAVEDAEQLDYPRQGADQQ